MAGDYKKEKLEAIERAQGNWEDTTVRRAVERRPERKESFLSSTWTPLKRLYTPLDVAELDYEKDLGFPGDHPFTRGVFPTMYRGKLWTFRTQVGFGGAEDTRNRLEALIKAGGAISLDFDNPTLIGLDPDDPLCEGEVGQGGLSVSCLRDFEPLFEGIPLDRVTTSMTVNFTAPVVYAMYLAVADKQGVPWDRISGTVQFDLLKEYLTMKCYVFPPKPALRLWTDFVGFSVRNTPRWNNTSIWLVGPTAAHTIGWGLASAMTYVDAALQAGMDVDTFAPRLSFLNASTIDFFESIAKLRALRRLWARIMKEKYGARNPDSCKLRIYYPASPGDLKSREPLNNIVRSTISVLASVLGGANAIDMGAYDEPFAIPSQEAKRLCVRTQQIIAHESRVADVVDPLGGSYYLESYTNRLEEEAKRLIKEVEALGGYVHCIESGYFQRISNRYMTRMYEEERCGERPVVGVNLFRSDQEDRPMELHETDPEVERRQSERIRRVRAERDNGAVGPVLQNIRDAAAGDANVMPAIIAAVKAHCTLGEIMQALKDVWGEYQETPAF